MQLAGTAQSESADLTFRLSFLMCWAGSLRFRTPWACANSELAHYSLSCLGCPFRLLCALKG
jgi:hypothetical protein